MGILALALIPAAFLFWLGWLVEGIGSKKRVEIAAQKQLDKWHEEYYARVRRWEKEHGK